MLLKLLSCVNRLLTCLRWFNRHSGHSANTSEQFLFSSQQKDLFLQKEVLFVDMQILYFFVCLVFYGFFHIISVTSHTEVIWVSKIVWLSNILHWSSWIYTMIQTVRYQPKTSSRISPIFYLRSLFLMWQLKTPCSEKACCKYTGRRPEVFQYVLCWGGSQHSQHAATGTWSANFHQDPSLCKLLRLCKLRARWLQLGRCRFPGWTFFQLHVLHRDQALDDDLWLFKARAFEGLLSSDALATSIYSTSSSIFIRSSFTLVTNLFVIRSIRCALSFSQMQAWPLETALFTSV